MATIIKKDDVLTRLQELGKQFVKLYADGQYVQAKHCYDTARTIACFWGLEESDMIILFGNRDREIQGVFPENIVQRVFYHTSVKGNEDNTNESMEDNELKHMQRRLLGIYAKK